MGTIIAKENILTAKKGVFAGGDAVTGSTTMISAASSSVKTCILGRTNSFALNSDLGAF